MNCSFVLFLLAPSPVREYWKAKSRCIRIYNILVIDLLGVVSASLFSIPICKQGWNLRKPTTKLVINGNWISSMEHHIRINTFNYQVLKLERGCHPSVMAPLDRNLEKKPRKDAIISSNANRSIIPFTSNVLLYWELTEIRVGHENIVNFLFNLIATGKDKETVSISKIKILKYFFKQMARKIYLYLHNKGRVRMGVSKI